MSPSKTLPNRPLRKNQENRPRGCGEWVSEPVTQKLGWLDNFEPARCGYPGQNLAPVIIGIMIAIIPMPAVPIVRAVIGSIIRSGVIRVRIRVTVRVISVIARTESDTEVNLSIRTRRPCKHQTPSHGCNYQKFLHDLPPDNLTGKSVESFVGYSQAERLTYPVIATV